MEYVEDTMEDTMETQSEHLNQFEIQSGMTSCFVYAKISLLLQYRTIVFDYQMILLVAKRTVKQLLKVPLL